MKYTQEERFIAIDTPLGKDVLLLQGFAGTEGISRLFRFDLELLSENPSISFDQIVGQKVTIRVFLADGEKRYINGYVSRFAQSGSDHRFTHYQAEVVPWLWFLTRRANCRIFQNQSALDIIQKICSDSAYKGISEFQNRVQGSPEQREYCVQYRETDFNFVSRLLEEEGIFYFFEHGDGKHTMILANSPTAHKPCPGQSKARYDYAVTHHERDDVIRAWQIGQELRTGKYALTDYSFETPSTSLAVNEATTVSVDGNSRYEMFDYPGPHLKKPRGQHLVKLRMEEEETPAIMVSGSSMCRAFTSGYKFDLTDHYRADMNKAYVLTEVRHSTTVGDAYATGGEGEISYRNQFTCIPHSVPFRPPRLTPKPVVQGSQTAVVVGKDGEEIWTDKYGRVKVHFHWDRENKWNENSSCWIRVSQIWAGKRWGAMFIPRIGQEVIVDFLEGDPDQPIIIGRVYNAEEMPHYELTKHQTRSYIKTLSTKSGGGFNELRFEDDKGKEQIFIHGEKDMDVRVKEDYKEYIGKDQHLIVKSNLNEKVDQNWYQKTGMSIVIESGMELTLKSSGGFIKIDPSGIYINGIMVYINSGGAPGIIAMPPKEADDGEAGSVDKVPKRDPRVTY
jgi:type VI secretion system secreted protein VgrG